MQSKRKRMAASPSLDGVNIRHWAGYSHSISENAVVALRAL